MAWLSGLAGKAENLLNKIDQNTAAVLNKDKYDVLQPQLTEVTWIPPQSRAEESAVSKSTNESPKQLPYVRSTPNIRSLSPITNVMAKEEELFTSLNTPSASPRKMGSEFITSPPTPSSLLVEHPTDNTDSVSELSIRSGRSSPELTHASIDVPENDYFEPEINDQSETLLLGSQIEQAHIETINTLDTVTNTMNGFSGVEEQFNTMQEYTYEVNEITDNTIKPSLIIENQLAKHHINGFDQDTKTTKESLSRQETDHQKEIAVLNEKIQMLLSEKQELRDQITDLQFTIERNRSELNLTRSELEQHRARALKTLQEKEKLIAELRTNVTLGVDDTTMMELNQLRQERDILREENQQICEQLRTLREELVNADLKMEKIRQESTKANIQAQEVLATERRRRLDVEEDARLRSEEVRSLKDELLRQRNTFSLQLQKRESEISRLKMQITTVPTPSNEMEMRLSSLTQTLVLKQQALESLTTERNALRLQVEKMQHEFRNSTGSRRNTAYNNINDTDDAKAQVPTFLMETPFDTGVTRRVKRAYSSLDAISIRTGVFLRRYPLARILVLIYMALLQFWVLVVLLSQSPDAH